MSNKFLLTLSAATCFLILIVLFPFKNNVEVKDELVGDFYEVLKLGDITADFGSGETHGEFEGEKVIIPVAKASNTQHTVLGTNNENKWIEVDLSEQKLKAWEGDRLFAETLVSTGLPWWPTPTGEFRIWAKLESKGMRGGTGRYAYNLPNVPYVMFFEGSGITGSKGYGLHGTYWHNNFGTQRSHGCVNLPTDIAKQLYYWVSPVQPEGKRSVNATAENLGTRIVIHE